MSESKGLEIDWSQDGQYGFDEQVVRAVYADCQAVEMEDDSWRIYDSKSLFRGVPLNVGGASRSAAWKEAREHPNVQAWERTHRPQEVPEWEMARRRVLAKWPYAEAIEMHNGSWRIAKRPGAYWDVLSLGCNYESEAWTEAATRVHADREVAAVPETAKTPESGSGEGGTDDPYYLKAGAQVLAKHDREWELMPPQMKDLCPRNVDYYRDKLIGAFAYSAGLQANLAALAPPVEAAVDEREEFEKAVETLTPELWAARNESISRDVLTVAWALWQARASLSGKDGR